MIVQAIPPPPEIFGGGDISPPPIPPGIDTHGQGGLFMKVNSFIVVLEIKLNAIILFLF